MSRTLRPDKHTHAAITLKKPKWVCALCAKQRLRNTCVIHINGYCLDETELDKLRDSLRWVRTTNPSAQSH